MSVGSSLCLQMLYKSKQDSTTTLCVQKKFFTMLKCLIILLAVCLGKASAGQVINCDGNVQRISCNEGVIIINGAEYGRKDDTTCITWRPQNELTNTHCSLSGVLPVISQRCNGKKVCEFPVFFPSDPCFGTYKYLNTTYSCVSARTAVTCEFGHMTLDCGQDIIEITSSNYGRRDGSTCSGDRPANQLAMTECYLPRTLSDVSSSCNGKSLCSLSAGSFVPFDPCVGTYKYLEVTYICVSSEN
ncbi:L-rhamnose-binding lectin CSL2-like [Denticeps clupeoides]|uniref:SUEL-type lectin domain-containing protein n=1 Tax=Denticeps clupeoides TaxID=299321 RepID=A0AAY4CP66_9TELE|nr:L-rhamnose-binding lectin CSL2-like [Denticeps clupeoides]